MYVTVSFFSKATVYDNISQHICLLKPVHCGKWMIRKCVTLFYFLWYPFFTLQKSCCSNCHSDTEAFLYYFWREHKFYSIFLWYLQCSIILRKTDEIMITKSSYHCYFIQLSLQSKTLLIFDNLHFLSVSGTKMIFFM